MGRSCPLLPDLAETVGAGGECLVLSKVPAHQNHPVYHSKFLHHQGRILLQGAVQVIPQQAVRVMLALPNRYVGTGHPDARRYTLTFPPPSLSLEEVSRSALSLLWGDVITRVTPLYMTPLDSHWDLCNMMSLTLEGLKMGALLCCPAQRSLYPTSHWLPLLTPLWSLVIMGFEHE